MFQNTMQQVMQRVPGVCNIRYDIFVFSSPGDHHKALDAAVRRLHENGLTIKLTKCELYHPSPEPEKRDAVQKAIAPRSQSEIRSPLGMASYCSRFREMVTLKKTLEKETTFRRKYKNRSQRHFFSAAKHMLLRVVVEPVDARNDNLQFDHHPSPQ